MEKPPPPDVPEKNFIHEEYSKNPFPIYLWIFLIAIVACLIWGIYSWYNQTIATEQKKDPFLQVTNRQISLFLWQNPEYMRVNVKDKNGYLPGFKYQGKVGLEADAADQYVIAPPELLFLYHTWDRLIKDEFAQRPIIVGDFQDFLNYEEEWQPKYWPNAPEGYAKLVDSLSSAPDKDAQLVAVSDVPMDVRIAYQGWRNYFKEGDAINKIKATYADMQEFLQAFPHYARNYWRNIASVEGNEHRYLYTLTLGQFNPLDTIPDKEMPPFLKVAFYNFKMAEATK